MDQKKRLRPDQRLRKQTSFKNLVDKGLFARGVFFYVWTGSQQEIGQKSKFARPVIGIVVGRRTDARSTKRNTIKRRVREIFRKHQERFKNECACLIKARASKEIPSFSVMEEELVQLFKKTGAWA